MKKEKSVCVYCGSQAGGNPEITTGATELGRSMAKNQIKLVYGGGSKGIMGEVARATFQYGGTVLGIIPEFLVDMEASAKTIDEFGDVIVTKNMHERKRMMFEKSDAFVALPGGIGTLEEIVEIMTWAQLGRHEKPMVLANIGGFWDPMLKLLDHMEEEGFFHAASRVRPIVVNNPGLIVETLIAEFDTPTRVQD